VHFAGRHTERERVRSVLQSVVMADADLLLAASIPLARDALTDPITIAIAAASLAILLTTKLDTLWIILGAAVAALSAACLVGALFSSQCHGGECGDKDQPHDDENQLLHKGIPLHSR
jgi:hypothetical protein